MAMYDTLKGIIQSGQYDLVLMIDKIDVVWAEAKLENSQRTELIDLARENANAQYGVDVYKKLKELDSRVTALENAQSTDQPEEPTESNEYPEYAAGKWYYNGDKITYGGKKYHCVAPSGQVCVWSPDEYPAYWEEDV